MSESRLPGGGYGFFFTVTTSRLLPGHLLGVYRGQNNRDLGIPYGEARKKWNGGAYVLSCPFSRYVVDGASWCGPARANDGFHEVNAYLVYNTIFHRMEIRLAGSAEPGTYEVLVNYDVPHCWPAYWAQHRSCLLTPDSLMACQAYYQPMKGTKGWRPSRANMPTLSSPTHPPAGADGPVEHPTVISAPPPQGAKVFTFTT